MIQFVVSMYRWGCLKNHHYLIGIYPTLENAREEGEKEQMSRSNKYEPFIRKFVDGIPADTLNYSTNTIIAYEFKGEQFPIPNWSEENG